MPLIYLSPSTQHFNISVLGPSEETLMNNIADVMIPYLNSTGIYYERNTPDMTAASSIRASNAGNFDLHLALHSNAGGPGYEGRMRGIDFYYYPTSTSGKRFADILVQNFKTIYPLPDLVRALPTTAIGEVARTRAPSVLAELGYHDNYADATWIVENTNLIAQTLVKSLADYFGIPFVSPQGTQNATVDITSGTLNIRSAPSALSSPVAYAHRGDPISVLSRVDDWYQVVFNGVYGYAFSDFIRLNS